MAMTWNYRVMRRQYDGVTVFEIYECHYDDSEALKGWAATPTDVSAEEFGGVEWMLKKMLEALAKPVLDHATGKQI